MIFIIADIASKSKFHISIGHETVLAKLTLFGCPTNIKDAKTPDKDEIDQMSDSLKKLKVDGPSDSAHINFDFNNEYKVVPCISSDKEEEEAKKGADKAAFGLLEFERPVVIVPGCKSKYVESLPSSCNYH